MRKREIIFAVIASIMALFNVIGTVTVVAVNVTSGRDLVKECLMLVNPDAPVEKQIVPLKEDWTIPTKTTEPIPTEEPMVEIDTVEVIKTNPEETVEPPIESILETAPAEEIIDDEIDESALAAK